MCDDGLLVSRSTLEMTDGHGKVVLRRWHVFDVRVLRLSPPCVSDCSISGSAKRIKASHSSEESKSSTMKSDGLLWTRQTPG